MGSLPVKILMVCLGNICRSPLAEGILKSKLNSKKYFVDSAGTANYHTGKSPDPRSIDVAFKNGLDISSQQAQQFESKHFNEFDYIFVMDLENYHNILSLAKTEFDRGKVALILEETFHGQNAEVPDPYYGGVDGFDHVYGLLNSACEKIAKRI